jgi:transcriptional regulator with XRE-family HTH domain
MNNTYQMSNMKLGTILAEARKTNRLTIEEVAKKLHVPPKLLTLVEAGDYENLPPDAFLRGILRRYATFLGLQVVEIIELYDEESKGVRKIAGKSDLLPQNRFSAKGFNWAFDTKELIAIVTLAAFFYLLWQVSLFLMPPAIDLYSPISDTTITRASTFVISGRLKGAERVVINGTSVGVLRDGEFRYQLGLEKGENIIELRAENSRGKVTRVIRRILYQPEE